MIFSGLKIGLGDSAFYLNSSELRKLNYLKKFSCNMFFLKNFSNFYILESLNVLISSAVGRKNKL
mgnify:CR=1 FL=1